MNILPIEILLSRLHIGQLVLIKRVGKLQYEYFVYVKSTDTTVDLLAIENKNLLMDNDKRQNHRADTYKINEILYLFDISETSLKLDFAVNIIENKL